MKYLIPFFSLSVLLVHPGNGQDLSPVQNLPQFPEQPKLRKTQGTSEFANIYCSFRDKKGDLWFGTMGEGIYRYDGKTFTQFTVSNGLCNNYVYAIIEDVNGDLLFGTGYGVCKFNGTTFASFPIIVPDQNGASYILPANKFSIDQYGVPSLENAVWSIYRDKKGTYWFGATSGLFCYDGKTFTRFTGNKSISNPENLQLKMIDCIMEDRAGKIWLCSGMLPGEEGICCYDGVSLERIRPFGDGWIRNVIADTNGVLYFATRHRGVLQYDGKNFINITEKAGIDNGSVSSIQFDRSGNLWIGTELGSGQMGEDGGVWRFDGRSFRRFTTKDGLIHNGVFCIVEDASGKLWFGTRNIGLCSYDGKNFTAHSE
ncbi:MAG TPA: two-component regulator propeller domain-containing protein [Bacteroidia bacterium]|jgi:ligand-binding sensor domain-containing protein